MKRRAFLGALLATATLDPERLLWTPGKKLISIPTPERIMTAEECIREQLVADLEAFLATVFLAEPEHRNVEHGTAVGGSAATGVKKPPLAATLTAA